MNNKRRLTLMATILMAIVATAQTNPLWMRFCAISPDGQTIAFSYMGDLFTVPAQGGTAHQLTTNAGYDAYPVWSPDARSIAFASAREGSLDVYIVDKNGGTPKRLTTDSGNETPLCFLDDGTVLFEATDMPTAQSNLFASRSFPQVYQVSVSGGRAHLFSALPMQDLSINSRGDILYHDIKGYEDPFRKHHTSAITRDIWLQRDGQYTKLTDFNGEDRTPRWAADGNSYYYLSEQDGTFNVYKNTIGGQAKQLTRHKDNPVRFLTVADNGLLCYGYNGEIYTLREGGEPQRVDITISADRTDKELIRQVKSKGATSICVSPSGKEVAFVMHGDVYVTSVDYKTTKQVTNTPEQERTIDFSPDGRSIVYDSERNGMWQIYQTSIVNKDEKLFTYATDLKEEQLTNTGRTSFQPKYSPDGKSVAFLKDRCTLSAVDVKTKAVRTLMDDKYIYSYSDGDVWFEWSPDSRWLVSSYIGTGGWNSQDVALVSASGSKEIHNLTESGYNEGNAKWVLGGKAIIFGSDRAGFRSHGSWGSEDDVYIMFFDLDAYEHFKMSKEEKVLQEEAEKEKKKEADKQQAEKDKNTKKKNDKKKKGAEADKPEVPALQFDLENCRDRIARLTVNSARLGDAVLSTSGDTLYYLAAFEGDMDLWKHDLRENKTEIVLKGVGRGELIADKNCKNLFVCTQGGIKKIDLAKGKPEAVNFEANFNYRPQEEREYIFNHVWQQVKDKFYVENLHGVDWEAYRENYKRFLPYINNNYDFRDMLSEMLGELNGSHTGARYYPEGPSLQTAALGLFLDDTYQGDGLKVVEVIKRGPFDEKKTGVTPGCIIEKIDGNAIRANEDYNWMLDGKAGKPIRVTVFNPKTGKRSDVTVKAISKGAQQELLYKRWVDRNRALVDSLSGGQLAYVHVKEMNSQSFRTVYRELLSDKNRNRKAVIVDERHNGGGWLHDDLCTLLSGHQYQSFVPQGKYVGADPFNKWTKPSCVLMCEDDYSNGHGFPFVYRELGIGKLIGTPVAGTMTAVWWETLIDDTMIFDIPQVGCVDMRGNYCENTPLLPDIEVYNTPEDYLSGHDRQLERAVQEMLK
ncbi:MAG: PD40 domain-containing protein [Muribaculaceae bacterium]|nr:PD40 domain-containing protein [Muribaculaceae bacterium]